MIMINDDDCRVQPGLFVVGKLEFISTKWALEGWTRLDIDSYVAQVWLHSEIVPIPVPDNTAAIAPVLPVWVETMASPPAAGAANPPYFLRCFPDERPQVHTYI